MGILDRFRRIKRESLEKLDNRTLLSAIDTLAHDDSPESRDRVYRTLLNTILLLPVAEIPAGYVPGENIAHERTPLKFPLLRDACGNKVVPIFSDVEALYNWHTSALYVGLRSIDIFKMILATDADQIKINPFDPARKMIKPGGILTRQEFQLLSERKIPTGQVGSAITFNVGGGRKVTIGIPANEPPQAVLDALTSTAQKIESVTALCLAQIAWPADQGWTNQTLIGIELNGNHDQHRTEEIVMHFAEVLRANLGQHEFLDLAVLEGAFGQQVRSHGKVLFQRS